MQADQALQLLGEMRAIVRLALGERLLFAVIGRGQVIDAAMVDGASYLMSMIYSGYASGLWRNERGANLVDGGAPFYDTYACADGKYVAVGAMEPQFFEQLVTALGLAGVPAQHDRAVRTGGRARGGEQGRLANAGRAGHHDHAARARPGRGEQAAELAQLRVAVQQRLHFRKLTPPSGPCKCVPAGNLVAGSTMRGWQAPGEHRSTLPTQEDTR